MRVYARRLLSAASFGLLALITVSAQTAIRAEKIYTMEGGAISNGVVLIKDGKIEAVGSANSIRIPAGYNVLSAKVLTPGLIDAHSVIGLAGYLNQPHDQMQIEDSSPIQPELRAIDAYNAREELIGWVRSLGVTTIHTGHAPAALVSGQTMIAKTTGDTVDKATLVPMAMVAATIGDASNRSGGRSPGSLAKQAAMLREQFIKASQYDPAKAKARDLRLETLRLVLDRKIPMLVTAHRARDIMTALRIAKEFNINIVLDGVSEAHLVADEIKKSGFPVILHPTMYRAGGETESLSMNTAALLREKGIKFALQSGYETYVPKTRVVLFEAAATLRNGLGFEDALRSITINSAEILGLSDRIGSIKVGKDADLAMFDGDPFEFTSHCTGTIVNGSVVSEAIR
ncbi:MAG: amidohydrolase family protein [Pyrinomonadaceae bacterium]